MFASSASLHIVGQPAPVFFTEPRTAENCLIVRVALWRGGGGDGVCSALRVAAVPAAAAAAAGLELVLVGAAPTPTAAAPCEVRVRFQPTASSATADAPPATVRIEVSCASSDGADGIAVASTGPIEVRCAQRPSARAFSGFARPRKRARRSSSDSRYSPAAAALAYRNQRGRTLGRSVQGFELLGLVLDLPEDEHGNPRERICVEEVDARPPRTNRSFRCAYLDGPQRGSCLWEARDDLRAATVVGRVLDRRTRCQDLVGYTVELPADAEGNPAEVVRVVEYVPHRAAPYRCRYISGPCAGNALWEESKEFRHAVVVEPREASGLAAKRSIGPGKVVWVKVAGSPWWPGLIVDAADVERQYAGLVAAVVATTAAAAAAQRRRNSGVHLVMFMHYHNFSAVLDENIVEWNDRCEARIECRGARLSSVIRRKLESAVAEAKRELGKPRLLRFQTPPFRSHFLGHRDPSEAERTVPGCWVCFADDAHDALLVCDYPGCKREYHTYCIVPQLKGIASGDWHCPRCADWLRGGGSSQVASSSNSSSSSSASSDPTRGVESASARDAHAAASPSARGLLHSGAKRLSQQSDASSSASPPSSPAGSLAVGGIPVAVGSGRPLALQHARVMIGSQFQATVPKWSGSATAAAAAAAAATTAAAQPHPSATRRRSSSRCTHAMHEPCPHYDVQCWSGAETSCFALASVMYPNQIALIQQDVKTRSMQQCVQHFYTVQASASTSASASASATASATTSATASVSASATDFATASASASSVSATASSRR